MWVLMGGIAVIGGTGELGRGLIVHWAAAGEKIVIGSRSREKAERIARELSSRSGRKVVGATNRQAAEAADLVVLSIPFHSLIHRGGDTPGALTAENNPQRDRSAAVHPRGDFLRPAPIGLGGRRSGSLAPPVQGGVGLSHGRGEAAPAAGPGPVRCGDLWR